MWVISTAGHVDHGKSALVKRLTGIDPDRLAEEKRRGLTIDLGFAWLRLPSEREIGIVDVPGHERFVHNMLAGVGSVDATLFCVDAAEGWRPQSEEHLAILDLLGARGGVVALTKSDLADPAALAEASGAVHRRIAGTALAGAEIVAVSSVSGEGLGDLTAALERMLDRLPEPEDRGRARVFVDRSFSVKGAGTVVTGTLTGGRIAAGDAVEILPAGVQARVRGIQTHKRSVAEAAPAARVALNLAGVERYAVRRGDAVVAPRLWRPTSVIEADLRAVRSLARPVSGRGAYKAHIGSAEVDARLTLYDAAEVGAGGEALARVTLAAPVVAEPFDGVVLRDVGRGETVAGGRILDPHPPARVPRGAERERRVAQLRARAAAGRDGIAALALEEAGAVALDQLPWRTGRADPPGDAVSLDTFVLSRERFAELAARIEAALAAFHSSEPLAPGMRREDACSAAGLEDRRLFDEIVAAWADRIAADGARLRLAAHRVSLSPEQQAARDAIARELEAGGFAPPPLAEIARRHGDGLVRALTDAGDLVRVGPDLAFTPSQIERAREIVGAAIDGSGPQTTSALREVLGTSRKYAIPLLEHLDAAGFTRRRGDVRDLA